MDIILEIKVGGDVVRLQTRPGGDVEILACRNESERTEYRDGLYFFRAGGVFDYCIGIIPKSKRAEVAQFLVTAL